VTFYGGCLKMCKDFAPNFGDKKLAVTSQQCTTSHFLFHRKMFDQNQHDCHPSPPPPLTLLFSLPQLKIIFMGRHFDTTEVMKAESQAVLTTHTEHDFLTFNMHLKNGRSAGNGAYEQKETFSRVMVASRPKVSF
jgi:hypothetical protein